MVTVAQCRDSMKSTLLRYMVTLFLSFIASVYYLGAKIATLETKVDYNGRSIERYRGEQLNENEKFSKKLDTIVDRSSHIFQKCCDTRLVKKGTDERTAIQ